MPPYSPTLNAIEPLWKSLKREISPEIYEDEDHFREFLTETFLRLSHRLSFAVEWIERFSQMSKYYAGHSSAWLTAYAYYIRTILRR